MAESTSRDNKITVRKSRVNLYPSGGLSAGELAYSYTSGSLYIGNSGENGALEIGGTRVNQTLADIVAGYDPFNNGIAANGADSARKAGGADAPAGGTAGLTLAAGLQMQKTPAASSNNLEIATTAYVDNAVGSSVTGVSEVDGLTGDIDLVGGTGMGVLTAGAGDNLVTFFGLTAGAQKENIGMAAFDSASFSITDNGLVAVKAEGISTDQLLGGRLPPIGVVHSLGSAGLDVHRLGGRGFTLESIDNQTKITLALIADPNPDRVKIGLADTVNLTHGITAPKISITDSMVGTFNMTDGLTVEQLTVSGTGSVSEDFSVGGTLDVTGNLVVSGLVTTVNVSTLEIEDAFVELSNDSGNSDQDFGIFSQIGGSNYTGLNYDSSTSRYYLFESSSFDGANAITTSEAAGNMGKFKAQLDQCLIDGGGF